MKPPLSSFGVYAIRKLVTLVSSLYSAQNKVHFSKGFFFAFHVCFLSLNSYLGVQIYQGIGMIKRSKLSNSCTGCVIAIDFFPGFLRLKLAYKTKIILKSLRSGLLRSTFKKIFESKCNSLNAISRIELRLLHFWL